MYIYRTWDLKKLCMITLPLNRFWTSSTQIEHPPLSAALGSLEGRGRTRCRDRAWGLATSAMSTKPRISRQEPTSWWTSSNSSTLHQNKHSITLLLSSMHWLLNGLWFVCVKETSWKINEYDLWVQCKLKDVQLFLTNYLYLKIILKFKTAKIWSELVSKFCIYTYLYLIKMMFIANKISHFFFF